MRVYIERLDRKIDKRVRDELREKYLGGVLSSSISDIKYSDNGKPYIKGCQYRFNISHSGNVYVFGVSESEIGIDVEVKREIDSGMLKKLIKRVTGDDMDMDSIEFLRLWTIKEAYLKFLGVGLGLELSKIEVNHDDSSIHFRGMCDAYFKQMEKDDIVYTVVSLLKIDTLEETAI